MLFLRPVETAVILEGLVCWHHVLRTVFVIEYRICLRTAEAPSQQDPRATRNGLESDGESESDGSSGCGQDDEDADVLEMLKHLPNIFVQDALSERYW